MFHFKTSILGVLVLAACTLSASAMPMPQDAYGGGGAGNAGVGFTGPSPDEMAKAREDARERAARSAAVRQEKAKRLAELKKKQPKPAPKPLTEQAESRAASLVTMASALEASNRSAAIDHYSRALQTAPNGRAARAAAERLSKLGVDPAIAALPRFKVLRVLDDSSIVMACDSGERVVQLAGVKACELPESSKSLARRDADASAYIKRLVADTQVAVQVDDSNRTEDESSRTRVFLYRFPDGLFVNNELVKQGYAQADAKQVSDHTDEFEQAEQQARTARRGLWSDQASASTNKK